MLPPGTDFIIAYMDSLPVLAGSETGDSWSQCDSLEQDFTHQGMGGGGGWGAFRTQWVKLGMKLSLLLLVHQLSLLIA